MAEAQPFNRTVAGAKQEFRRGAKAEAQQRNNAANILTPEEVRTGEWWDSGKTLLTTFGSGVLRDLKQSDLAAFGRNMETVKERFNKGITPAHVIDFSTRDDIDRANKQINQTVLHSAVTQKGHVGAICHFITNAGPDSKVSRHHVHAELLSLRAAVNSRKDSRTMALWLCKDKLLFDCDCERHRYYFRYIATTGQFYFGRPEHGYPKITNPNLSGVACKHVLPVMHRLKQGFFVPQVQKLIDKLRKQEGVTPVSVKTTQKQADDSGKAQEGKAVNITTLEARQARTEKAREAAAAVREARKMAEKLAENKKAGAKPKTKTQTARKAARDAYSDTQVRAALAKRGMSGSEIEAIIADMKGTGK